MATTTEHVPDLVSEILTRRERRLRAGASQYARRNPIASDADPESCLRRQVLEIVAWKDKPLRDDPWLQAFFEAGKRLENEAKRWLLEDGFEVIEGQYRFELKHRRTGETALSGKVDFSIDWNGAKPKVEHKLVSPFVFDRVNAVDDFYSYRWMKKYPAQMQAYLIGNNEEWGIFMLTDGRGTWKVLRVDLDYGFAERIWSFAESIVDAVHQYQMSGELPVCTKDQEQCESCSFFGRRCNPEIRNPGAVLIDSLPLEDVMREWQELREAGERFIKLDRKVKDELKKLRKDDEPRMILPGGWTVEWSPRRYKEKFVEAHTVPAKTVWVPKIEWVEG